MSKTRTPAPMLLVTVPVGLIMRPVRKKRAAASQSAALDSAIAKRLPPREEESAVEMPARVSARTWMYRNRRAVLAPVATAGLLATARFTASMAPEALAAGRFAVVVPALLLAFAAHRWVQKISDPKNARAAQLVALLALVWLVWPAGWQLPTGAPDHLTRWAILFLGTLIVCGFRHQRFAPREEAPEPVVLGPAEKWAVTVGADGPLAGTYLRNVARVVSQDGVDVGWTAEAVCAWGQHNATKVIAQRELIVGAYGRDLIDFTPERTGNALVARIMLTERDPFPTKLTAKTWLNDDGTLIPGSYADGSDCPMRLFTPGHGVHDLWLFGIKGSGKSVLAANILGSVMSRGWVVLHLTDLKGGMSLPEWKQVAFRFGKAAADGLMQLRRLDAIGEARMAECERNGWKLLPINDEWPIHLGVTEEAPQLWKIKEAVLIAERIKTLYRAVNIALMDISQMAELQQAWGGSGTLRTQAQGGNVGCGYLPKAEAKLGFDHFNPDMGLIEKGSYHWYITSPVESREVLVKIALVDSEEVAAKAVPGTPNPIDLAAVERVEQAEAERLAEVEAEVKIEAEVKAVGVTRETVEAALVQAVKAAGGPVLLGAVAGILAPAGMDELTRKRHDDRVRQQLKQLVADPSSIACKPTDAAGNAEWGKYGVAA